jgi:hypothetical protein
MKYIKPLQAWYHYTMAGLRSGLQFDDWYQRAAEGCVVHVYLG